MFTVPGPMMSTLNVLSHFISTMRNEIVPIFQIRKVRFREVKIIFQAHASSKKQGGKPKLCPMLMLSPV